MCLTLECNRWGGLTASLADSLIDSLQGHTEPMGNMKSNSSKSRTDCLYVPAQRY